VSGTAAITRTILRNDLRLFWRGAASRKHAWLTGTLGRVCIVAVLHLMTFGVMAPFAAAPQASGAPVAALVALLFMVMAALHRSLEVLYNRGDLPLLLASPVPARVVLTTRLCDIALTSLLGTLAIVLPLLDAAMVLFGWYWAWGFAAWLATTLVVVPLAVLATLTAVERIGVRRARLCVQASGLVVGMLGVVVAQLPNWMAMRSDDAPARPRRPQLRGDVFEWFDVPPLRQLADAARGDWRWLLPLLALAVVLFACARVALARRFVHGALGAAADLGDGARARSSPRSTAAWLTAVPRDRGRTLLRTQLLLLRRDPMLMLRCAMQTVSLVPMLVVALMLDPTVGLGGVTLLAAAILPVTLAAMINTGDEAHEFAAAAPVRPRELAHARARAAALPLWLLVAVLTAVVVVMGDWLTALLVAGTGSVLAYASAWLGVCTTRAHTAEERARNRPPRIAWQTFLAMALAGMGGGALAAIRAGALWLGALLFAFDVGCAVLVLRIEPRRPVYDA